MRIAFWNHANILSFNFITIPANFHSSWAKYSPNTRRMNYAIAKSTHFYPVCLLWDRKKAFLRIFKYKMTDCISDREKQVVLPYLNKIKSWIENIKWSVDYSSWLPDNITVAYLKTKENKPINNQPESPLHGQLSNDSGKANPWSPSTNEWFGLIMSNR